ncbi:MAG: hypothetical protein ABJM29_17025 [Rhizobiaceae bacterium]
MKRLISALFATCLASGAAFSAEPMKVDSLLLSLLQVQDRIARGDSAALPLQKHLMKLLDAGIAEAGSVADMSPAEYRALVTFGIVGTGSSAVVEALQEVKSPSLNRKLALAVIDYRMRRRNQATKRFAEIDSNKLDLRLIPFVAFAKGNLYSRKAPKAAVKQYNLVRLSAPGTLLEEASLRRLMSLHAAHGQGVPFARMAKQYARRFINSPYRQQYLKMLRSGIFAMRRSIKLDDVGELGRLMPPDFAVAFHMHLVRGALESGHIKLAKFSIDSIEELTAEENTVPVNQDQLQLFRLLSAMTTEDPASVMKSLDELDVSRLAPPDVKLLQRARGILGYIVAPIDDLQTHSTNSKASGSMDPQTMMQNSDGLEGDASSSPTSSARMELEKNQSEIDQFIGATQKRLSDIDSLLSQ